MKKLILYYLIFIPFLGFSQQKISLKECYDWAEKNYPLAKQTDLIQQKSTLEIGALHKAKLPKVDLNALATYQSDVIGLPTSLPGIQPINKDQYRATLDVNQLIYNGGMIAANSKLKEAQMQTVQQQVAINLYQLKSRINYAYMMILLFEEQSKLLVAKQNTINSRLKEVHSGVKNGANLPASEQVLEAELLKLDQALTENSFQRAKELQNLASLTTIEFAENTILENPSTDVQGAGFRPELQFFELQQAQIDASKEVISKSNLPKLSAFGQAGYGNPGLNMLDNSFQGFYIVGLKLNWNIFDWNKSRTDNQALDIAKEIITTEKDTFETNNQMQLNDLQSEIAKMEAIIKTDAKIIEIREKVMNAFDSQLRNGVITSSEYLTELNQLYDSKTNQKIHETQLELAKISYQTTLGTN